MYYFKRATGDEQGPVDPKQLKALARKGRISRHDLVRKADGSWRKASEIKGLFDPEDPDEDALGAPLARRTAAALVDPRISRSLDDEVLGRARPDGQRWVLLGGAAFIAVVAVVVALTLLSDSDGEHAATPDPAQRPSAAAVPLAARSPAPPRAPRVAPQPPAESQAQAAPAPVEEEPTAPVEPSSSSTDSTSSSSSPEAQDSPPAPEAQGITYIVGWDPSELEVSSDGSAEQEAEPGRPRVGDRLVVLPGCMATVLLRNGEQTVELTAGGGSAIEFAPPRNTPDFEQTVIELVSGRIRCELREGAGSRLQVLYRAGAARPRTATFLYAREGDASGAEIVRTSANPASPRQFRTYGEQVPPPNAGGLAPGGGIPLGSGIPLGGPPPLPAWVSSSPGEPRPSPLEKVLRSADLEPGVQRLTPELRASLVEALEPLADRRPPEGAPRRPPRRGRPQPRRTAAPAADLRDLAAASLELLRELPERFFDDPAEEATQAAL